MTTRQYTLLIVAAATTALAACTTDHDAPSATDGHIAFAAAVDAPVTRAATTGAIDYSQLAKTGFGVFAKGSLNWTNREVKYPGTKTAENIPVEAFAYPGNWTYNDSDSEPLIPWEDKTVSFFAYAPFMGVSGNDYTSSDPTGITAVTDGDNHDDNPAVKYTIATTPAEGVDLLWAVDNTTGLPWINATGSSTGGPVLFTFHHALSAIAFHVQAIIDQANDPDNLYDHSEVAKVLGTGGNFKLTIKGVTITGPFYKTNILYLDNRSQTGSKPYKPAVYWGKTEEQETELKVPTEQVDPDIKHFEVDDVKEEDKGKQVMEKVDFEGVTQDPRQLLIAKNTAGKEQMLFVIPNSTPADYTVTLNWCVNGTAPDDSPVFEERNTSIKLKNWTLEPDTKYYINFVLGLHTLRLDVTAQDWADVLVPVDIVIERGTSASSSLARRTN